MPGRGRAIEVDGEPGVPRAGRDAHGPARRSSPRRTSRSRLTRDRCCRQLPGLTALERRSQARPLRNSHREPGTAAIASNVPGSLRHASGRMRDANTDTGFTWHLDGAVVKVLQDASVGAGVGGGAEPTVAGVDDRNRAQGTIPGPPPPAEPRPPPPDEPLNSRAGGVRDGRQGTRPRGPTVRNVS